MGQAKHVVLSGAALRAVVRLAEAPGTGELVKRNLAAQLALDELWELDLREPNPEPAAMPIQRGGDDD